MSNVEELNPDLRLFTFGEALERLRISRFAGYELVKQGDLESLKIGARRYVTAGALKKFIEARLAAAARESGEARSNRVRRAVEGRALQRAKQRARRKAED